jgi:hypothetical protein
LGNLGFTFHLLAPASYSLTVSPLLLQFTCELRFLLAKAMEEERSPILDIVGGEPDVPQSEVSVTSSMSEDSSGEGSGDDAIAEVEDIGALDP